MYSCAGCATKRCSCIRQGLSCTDGCKYTSDFSNKNNQIVDMADDDDEDDEDDGDDNSVDGVDENEMILWIDILHDLKMW